MGALPEKWRQNLNKELENKKRAKYHQNKATKSTEQLENKKMEKARIRKALSREKQKESLSCQKLQGLK